MENLQVGDIITARRSGIHKVVGFKTMQWGGKPYVEYQMIAREDGTPVKSRTISRCADYYCNKATDYFRSEITNNQNRMERLHKGLKFALDAENKQV